MQIAHSTASSNRLVQDTDRPFISLRLDGNSRVNRLGTVTSPSSGASSPTIMRKRVVLPAPFGPNQADLLTRIQLKGSVNKDQLLAVLLVKIRERNIGKHQPSRLRQVSRASPNYCLAI